MSKELINRILEDVGLESIVKENKEENFSGQQEVSKITDITKGPNNREKDS